MDAWCETKIYSTKCGRQMDEDVNPMKTQKKSRHSEPIFISTDPVISRCIMGGVGVGHLRFGKKTMAIIMERLK